MSPGSRAPSGPVAAPEHPHEEAPLRFSPEQLQDLMPQQPSFFAEHGHSISAEPGSTVEGSALDAPGSAIANALRLRRVSL